MQLESLSPFLLKLQDFYLNFNIKQVEWVLRWEYPLIASVVYLVLSYGLKSVFGTEKPLNSKTTDKSVANNNNNTDKKSKDGLLMYFFTQLHNVNLIVLSFSMLCGIVYEIVQRSLTLGVFRGSICPLDSATNQDDHPVVSGPVAFWIFIYHLSKYYELVDTMLIVFKRKPLILLHVYHHLIMIWITWSWMKDPWLVGSWWCVMVNSIIHTIMYYYYLRTAQGYTLKWKTILTAGQIIQLFSGFFLVTYWFFIRVENECTRGFYSGVFSHVVNGTLILQFIYFYYRSYIAPKKEKSN
nr:unnamed protein product [Naegleria fowleri]